MSQSSSIADRRSTGLKQQNDGNFAEALASYRVLCLDPKNDDRETASDLRQAVKCLNQLGRLAEFDALVEETIAAHPKNWRLLSAAAEQYIQVQKVGRKISGKFQRGQHRGGGEYTSSLDRDRVRALQLMMAARPMAQADDDKSSVGEFFLELARYLLYSREALEAWRLQYLTDTATLPDYESGQHFRFQNSGAPVDDQGDPIFYLAAKSWETAENDGQRWRWALEQAVENSPQLRNSTKVAVAEFLQSQFGVETLSSWAGILPQPQESAEQEKRSGIFSLHTLRDDETIARLASGVKRFKLPDEFNPIKIYQQVADDPQTGLGEQAFNALAVLFANRRQLPRAASYWKRSIELYGPGTDNWKTHQLNQIIGNWGRFEATESQPAGQGAQFDFVFRNATEVSFEASPINIERLLTDIKAYLKSNPKELDWEKIQIEEIGLRLVQSQAQQYLGARAASWTESLTPREAHFNTRAAISSPLRNAGAYYVTARVQNGNTCHTVLWVADTAIVKKPLNGKTLYFIGDATNGSPIDKANVEFFGWKLSYAKNGRAQIETKNLAENTDTNGFVMPDNRALPNDHQWLAIARTHAGRLAFLGFHSIWGGTFRNEFDPVAAKAFVITDRPVYRPGQNVEFKVWIRQAQYDGEGTRGWANQAFAIEVRNPQNEHVFKGSVQSDAYAGASGTFRLPTDAKLGVYHLQVPNYGGLSFRVEEYKKPEFEVLVKTPEEPVMLGQVIKAKIQAKYYFGSAVSNGTVKYKVTRTAHQQNWYPLGRWDWCYGPGYWWFSYDYSWYPGWTNWAGCLRPIQAWWPQGQNPPEIVVEREVPLNEEGEVEVLIDTSLVKEIHGDQNQQYEISAEVRDASRRTIVGQGKVLVASQPFKVFTWLDRGYYRSGATIQANFHAQTIDHKPIAGKGKLRLLKVRYQADQAPEESPEELLVQEWDLNTSAQGEAAQKIIAGQPGQYRLSYHLTDSQSHTIEGGYVFTIVGRGFDGREFRYNDLELIPDKPDYRPEDKVQLLINSNRADGTVLLFVRPSNGVYPAPQLLQLKGKSTLKEIAVVKRDMPNFFVEAITISNGQVHTEVKEVVVPPEQRVLNLSAVPSKETYRPGEKGKIRVRLTDSTGERFVGSTALAVYDKAVEYISGGSNVPDIKKFFWSSRRYHRPSSEHNLDRWSMHIPQPNQPDMHPVGVFGESLVDEGMNPSRMARSQLPGAMGGFGGGGMGGMAGGMGMRGMQPMMMAKAGGMAAAEAFDLALGDSAANAALLVEPTIRSNFADTALWVSSLTTDQTGEAEVEVVMPENLTTWKIRAWGMGHGTRVGSGESEIVTRKNLIVRLQAPRFLVQNDEVVLSANVHNYLPSDKDVTVTLELPGEKLQARDALTTVVRIPANGEKRVDWKVKVVSEGQALVRMKALTDEESDAMEMPVPCQVHGILKTESWAGTVRPEKESASINIRVPRERRVPQSLLEVRYSPSLAAAMVDALPYLVDYPYGCTEQTLNRFLPTVLTQKILREMNLDLGEIKDKRTNLNAQELGDDVSRAQKWKRWDRNPVFDSDDVNRMVKDGVTRLTNMQVSDGGWGWFSGFREQSSPHTTAVVVHGLQVARQNDVAIVPGVIEKGVEWLKRYQQQQIEILDRSSREPGKGKSVADALDALVYMILVDASADNVAMRNYLYRDRSHLGVYGKCLLGMALFQVKDQPKLDMVMRNLNQFLVEDPANETAYLRLPEDSYWWAWHGSGIESNAYFLKLLSRTDPRGPTAARLVKYLLNNRKHATYWNSTRDTALCIEALAEFIRATGEAHADMTVEIWLDGAKRKEVAITGENLFHFDNRFVLAGTELTDGDHQIEIRRRGNGSVYFNAYLTNFTLEDPITRAGLEVQVERQYYLLIPVDKRTKAPGQRGQVADQRVEKYERKLLASGDAVKSSDLIEIELEIESKNDYEYLLIEDWKAAGLEPFDIRSGYNSQGLPAYMELRDDRVSLFLQTLPRGKHSLRFRMRAETPGTFSALPSQVSAMYAPELRGNSDEHKLRINDLP